MHVPQDSMCKRTERIDNGPMEARCVIQGVRIDNGPMDMEARCVIRGVGGGMGSCGDDVRAVRATGTAERGESRNPHRHQDWSARRAHAQALVRSGVAVARPELPPTRPRASWPHARVESPQRTASRRRAAAGAWQGSGRHASGSTKHKQQRLALSWNDRGCRHTRNIPKRLFVLSIYCLCRLSCPLWVGSWYESAQKFPCARPLVITKVCFQNFRSWPSPRLFSGHD